MELPISETVYCPESNCDIEVEFCRSCDYYAGSSFDSVNCKYGEKLVDRIADHTKKRNYSKVKDGNSVYLISSCNAMALKVTEDDLEELEALINDDIEDNPEVKETVVDIFDIEESQNFKKVDVLDLGSDSYRLCKIGDSITGVSCEYNWLFELDVEVGIISKGEETPIFLVHEGEPFAAIMPIRLGDNWRSSIKNELSKIGLEAK